MTTQEIMNQLLAKERITRGDVALLLKSMKGKSKGEKKDKVRELTSQRGGSNFQGYSVADTLDDYEEF